MEDCFEGIICFETLNPSNNGNEPIRENETELGQKPSTNINTEILDINKNTCLPRANPAVLRTPVVCKPFEDAFQKVFKIANINPQRTVRSWMYIYVLCGRLCINSILAFGIFLSPVLLVLNAV